MNDPVENEVTEADIASFLSDAQWEELRRLSTLPDEARSSVASNCAVARVFFEAEQPKAQQRRKKMIRKAADLTQELRQLVVEIAKAHVISLETEEEDEKALLRELEHFEVKMRARIKHFKTGPVTDGFHFIVQSLNLTLIEHAHRTLNLSSKAKRDGFDATEFVVKFFEFAGYPNKGTGLRTKARNAIKELVDIMGGWDPEFRPGFKPRKGYSTTDLRMGWMFKG